MMDYVWGNRSTVVRNMQDQVPKHQGSWVPDLEGAPPFHEQDGRLGRSRLSD